LAQRYQLLGLGVLAIDGISFPFIPTAARGCARMEWTPRQPRLEGAEKAFCRFEVGRIEPPLNLS
jgi:hypothetical protein